MKKHLAITGVVLSAFILSACGGEDQKEADNKPAASEQKAQAPDRAALAADGKAAIKQFATSLKGELMAGMKAGGPVNAVQVCSTKAVELAEQISQEKSATLTRVSLKNRNPKMGVPSEWQTKILHEFDKRQAKGEDVTKLGFAEITEEGGKKQFRMMKAIPTGGVCLTCHGASLQPDVQAKIKELYPEDKATGYDAGQIRGAFVYVKDL